MAGPLEGLRVVDCTRGTAGPKATGMLADYGADVVWVEPPGGDPWRDTLAVPYSAYLRGKRSIECDLRDPAGRETLDALLDGADVFVESWRPGVAERLGVDFETLHARFPGLVHCSISGFGPVGPHRDLPGYEALVHAVVGSMSAQLGHRDGPKFVGLPFASTGAAHLSLIGILAALYRRETDGWGRQIETSLLDGVVAYLSQGWGYSEDPSRPMFGWSRFLGSGGGFRCADDEYLGFSTFGLGAFDRTVAVLGLADRIPPLAPGAGQGGLLPPEQAEILQQEVPGIFASQPRAVWLEKLLAADVAAIPILRPGEVFDDGQARHNEMVVTVDDGVLGAVEQVAPPIRFAATPGAVRGAAPSVGQHTEEVLAELRAGTLPRTPHPTGPPDERPLLDGVNVLDLGHWYAGPYSSRLLADLGADVIKLEPPRGDGMRAPGTAFEKAFNAAQAGKRSVAADIKDPDLRSLQDALVDWADVVHHNLRPGVAERLAIGYDDVRAAKPDAVYLHAPGWGSSGPDTLRQAFAPLMSGFTGASYEVAGRGNPPIAPAANEDSGAGMLGAVSLLMALLHRARTGQGQYLELPQLNSTMTDMGHVVRRTDGTVLGAGALDTGQFGTGPLHRLYPTADGWLLLAAATEAERGRLSAALDVDVSDPDVEQVLAARFAAERTTDMLERLRGSGVPTAVPAIDNNVPFMDDPENQRIGRVGEFVHPRYGRVREPAVMIRVGGTTLPEHRRAPELGEHTDSVLSWAGYDEDRIAALHARLVVR